MIGAQINGVDLRTPLTRNLRDQLYRLLLRHRVLFVRDQDLSTRQHIAFAEAFGPSLTFHSVVPADPEHPGVHDVHGSTVGWHIDASGLLEPPVATLLHAVEIPPTGGDTVWASGIAAYEGLPCDLKHGLDGKYVTHTPAEADRPIVAHPLVRAHPDTGEQYLYINLAPWVDPVILGMERSNSDALVDELRREYLRPEYQVRFRWSTGAVAMWDNRVVQHTGISDYSDGVGRHLQRICLARFYQQ